MIEFRFNSIMFIILSFIKFIILIKSLKLQINKIILSSQLEKVSPVYHLSLKATVNVTSTGKHKW